MDTGSGIVEKSRGKLKVGDALAPTLAFTLLIGSGFVVLWERHRGAAPVSVSIRSHLFIILTLIIFAVSLSLMRWTGPIAVESFGLGIEGGQHYRELRDTMPWKYIGYLTGGTALISAFISIASRQFRLSFLLIGFLMAVAMIVVYDLPFDDLLLPPNGDV